MSVTSIQLQTETRDKLKAIAAKGETYDDVIEELIVGYRAYLEEQLRKLEVGEFVPAEEVFDAIEATLSQGRRRGTPATR